MKIRPTTAFLAVFAAAGFATLPAMAGSAGESRVGSIYRPYVEPSAADLADTPPPPGIEVGKYRMLWNSLCPLGGDKFLLVSECKGRIRIDTGTVAEGRITRK